MGSSLYCGGDSDESCIGSVLPDPWYGPETTCEETFGTHGVACISGRNMSLVGSVGFWGAKGEDDMNKHERNAKAPKYIQRSSLESKLGMGRGWVLMMIR